jgi:RpiB/LacA/LacB family sugar-phosphate isomerase
VRVAVGADHGGFELKGIVASELSALGHEVIDVGAHTLDPADDYPDFSLALACVVAGGRAERGILICGSGVGACVAADKVPGIRASLVLDTYSAHQGVEHDDMNVLCLGARVVGPELALELVRTFVAARFSGEERHARRLAKVKAIEGRYSRPQGVHHEP